MKKLAMIILMMLPFSAHAYKIKQMIGDQELAVVDIKDDKTLSVGDKLLATSKDRNCSLEIVSIKDKFATVSTAKCEFQKELKINQELEKSLAVVNGTAAAPTATATAAATAKANATDDEEEDDDDEDSELHLRPGVSVFYSFADKLTINGDITVSGSTYNYTETNNTVAAPGIAVYLHTKGQANWEVEGGLGYEFPREIKSYSLSYSSTATSGDFADPKPQISFIFAFLNAKWVQPKFYIIGGGSLVIPNVKNSSFTFSPGSGGQIGIGTNITESTSIDFLVHFMALRASLKSATETIDNAAVSTGGIVLAVKQLF